MSMTPLSNLLDRELQWRQPGVARRTYMLQADDRVCAELACTQWRYRGQGRTADGQWAFTHPAWFWSDPRALNARGETAAVFEHRFLARGGRIACASGRTYTYRVEGFFRQAYIVSLPDGRDVFRLQRTPRFLRTEARLTFNVAAARECADLSLLVLLSWYAMVLFAHRRRSQAAAVPG